MQRKEQKTDIQIKKIDVTGFLLQGKQNAIPARRLADLLELKDTRTLRYLVDDARASGAVILSGNEGYYLPGGADDLSDVRHFVNRMEARARSNALCTQSAKTYLKERENETKEEC